MRQKIFIFILAAVFVFAQVGGVYAKGSSGGRSSGGAKSSSSSRSVGGYSGSSSSKSSSPSSKSTPPSSSSSSKSTSPSSSSSSKSTPPSSSSSSKSTPSSSSSGYSGSATSKSTSSDSSSRTAPSSYSGSSTSKSTGSASTSGTAAGGTTAKTASKTDTLKNSYMQDSYKKEMSKSNYTSYKQDLNNDQKAAYDRGFSSNYQSRRIDFDDSMRTRNQRISSFDTRPVIVNVNSGYYGSRFGWGSYYAGVWDMWFLTRASDMFWYHHWNDISPYRSYFQAQQFAEMEARVRALEQKGVQRDPNYLDSGVDPDLQFSKEYQEKYPDRIYSTNKYSAPGTNPVVVILIVAAVAVILIVIIRKVARRKPTATFNSRIY